MDPDVEAAINATAARAGMSPDQWRAMAQIESGLKPGSNYGAGTQYKGLFNVGNRGSQSEWARHGSGNIYNPMDNARAAAELAYENNQGFKNHFGRDPTPRETYLMHQQGLGFYTNGTMTNIAGNLPASARSNPANWTHAGFEKYWGDRLEHFANEPIPTGSDISDRIPMRHMSRMSDSGGGGGSPGISAAWRASAGDGGDGGGAGAPGQAPTDTTQQQQPDTFDVGAAMGDVQKRIAQQEQENTPPPLAPFQVQPMMTPAMIRARLMAQAMLNVDQGQGSTT